MTVSGIYQLTFASGSFYVGSSKNINRRVRGHLSCLRRGIHTNDRMQKAWRKHGDPEVAILARCAEDQLLATEQRFLDKCFGLPECMNLAPVAGRTTGVKLSAKTRAQMSRSRTGMKYGPPSEATRAKIGAANRGRVWTPEQRAAWSAAQKGSPVVLERMRRLSDGNIGRRGWSGKFTPEQVREIRNACTAGQSQHSVASRYGVTQGAIGLIVARKTYTWVEDRSLVVEQLAFNLVTEHHLAASAA